MSTSRNQYEIELLQNDPTALVTHYQSIIEIVVNKFITRGFFSSDDRMDVIQTVNEQLLEKKMSRIQEHFNGSVYLSTYFSKVVYNICLEISRRKQRQPKTVSDEVLRTVAQREWSPEQKLAIRDELLRLEAVLKGIRRRPTRTKISLKLFARVLLNDMDLGEYRKALAKDELAMVRTTFFDPYDALTDKEVYGIIVKLFNKIEDKNNDPDSMRKWLNQVVDRIVEVLNGDPPRSQHNRDSLKILIQMYYEQ